MIAVSVVSHGHGGMVERLVRALLAYPEVAQILVTKNIPETLLLPASDRVFLITNDSPKGFAENHNAAFIHCKQAFFCPLNPDIELPENPFPKLVALMDEMDAAVGAPLVKAADGRVEDSARHFPTIKLLVSKLFGGPDGRYPLAVGMSPFFPEWVAGMFMLFRSSAYASLGGFDSAYFLYYEDVDVCVRAWRAQLKIVCCPQIVVIHDARRDSHRHFRHFKWHLTSMARYFLKYWMRLPKLS